MSEPKRILIVSPHADDETLGVGGTIARLAAEGHEVTVAVLTGHGEDEAHPLWEPGVWEEIRREAREAYDILGVDRVLFREIPAVRVAEQPLWKVNRIAAEILEEVRPEVLFVPFQYDLHQDHRSLFHAFSVAWRPSSEVGRVVREIYCYETVSETHWNFPNVEPGFLPNVWMEISDTLEIKLRALACFESQVRPAPDARSLEAVQALAVWRGSQAGMKAAEAFVLVRRLF